MQRFKISIVLLCFLALFFQIPFSGNAFAAGTEKIAKKADNIETPKGFILKTVQRDGKPYRYAVYVPADYDPQKAYPTIIFLNGAGECGTDGFKQVAQGIGTAVMFDTEHWPFLIIFPQKPSIQETWLEDDDLVMAELKAVQSDYKVDDDRLYLTGLSQGGYGTWAIGAKHPDLFAAIVPICGGGDTEKVKALKSVPVWAFHGAADTTVLPAHSETMVRALKDAGGDVKLTLYPGVDHNSWDKAYREEKLYDWLLSHKRMK